MENSQSPTSSSARRVIGCLLAWIFGAVFIFAGVLKVRDPQLFTMQVRSFEMLPDPFNAFLALGLPWLEIFCGLAVVSGWLRTGGLLLLDAALVVFVGVLGLAFVQGRQIDCGCFGSAVRLSQVQELTLDTVLLIVGVGLLVWSLSVGKTAHRSAALA